MDVRRKLELKLPPPLKSVAAQVDEDGLYIVPGTPYRLMRNFNMCEGLGFGVFLLVVLMLL